MECTKKSRDRLTSHDNSLYFAWHCFGWSKVIHTTTGIVMVHRSEEIWNHETHCMQWPVCFLFSSAEYHREKTGFIGLYAQNCAVMLLLAWYCRVKSDHHHHPWLPGQYSGWAVSTSILNARQWCATLVPVNIWSTRRTSDHFLPSVIRHSQWSSRGSAFYQGVLHNIVEYIGLSPGYVDSNPVLLLVTRKQYDVLLCLLC